MYVKEREREKKRVGGRSERVRESVDVCSLRYTSIYSKLRATTRKIVM